MERIWCACCLGWTWKGRQDSGAAGPLSCMTANPDQRHARHIFHQLALWLSSKMIMHSLPSQAWTCLERSGVQHAPVKSRQREPGRTVVLHMQPVCTDSRCTHVYMCTCVAAQAGTEQMRSGVLACRKRLPGGVTSVYLRASASSSSCPATGASFSRLEPWMSVWYCRWMEVRQPHTQSGSLLLLLACNRRACLLSHATCHAALQLCPQISPGPPSRGQSRAATCREEQHAVARQLFARRPWLHVAQGGHGGSTLVVGALPPADM